MAGESEDEPDHKRGFSEGSRKRGWEGQEMELEHTRETLRRNNNDNNNQTKQGSAVVAVDLEQFRNHQLNEGYQAKFVVRQRTAQSQGNDRVGTTEAKKSSNKDTSFSKPAAESQNDSKTKQHKRSKRDDSRRDGGNGNQSLQKYLECEGLRKFIKEVEKITST